MRLPAMMCLCAALACAAEQRLRYWVEPCEDRSSGCRASDLELADWAMAAWEAASSGRLKLEKSAVRDGSQIRVLWAGAQRGNYGETRSVRENGVWAAEVYVRPAVVSPDEKDGLLREAIVYLTCVHETGHALGLPHTAEFADIMYSFQYGGDLAEYFGRYRRLLKSRGDIRKNAGMSDADRRSLERALDGRQE
jgi:hypothetical protein